jgi:hypothetical protein
LVPGIWIALRVLKNMQHLHNKLHVAVTRAQLLAESIVTRHLN